MAKANAPKTGSGKSKASTTPAQDGTRLIALDPWLAPYAQALRDRYQHYQWVRSRIDEAGGILGPISQGHHYFGFNRGHQGKQSGVWYREWAPGARELRLIGEFNNWDRGACPMARDEFGVWSIFLSDEQWGGKLVHGSR